MPRRARGDSRLAEEFGARLRLARTNRGLSQEALAHRAECHRTYVGQVERAETSPTLYNLVRLAKGLDMDPGDLVRGLRPYTSTDRRRRPTGRPDQGSG